VNVSQSADQLPENAGSIRTLTGRSADREELLAMLLADLGSRYTAWLEGGLDAVYEGLGPRDFLRGRHVTVNDVSGVVTMIDRAGRLEIGVGHGEQVTVESGEVVYGR
jgi:biotin-(acetyl-CoA carboxylase) ligase